MKEYKYYISYTYTNGSNLGFGGVCMSRKTEISTYEDINEIRNTIKKNRDKPEEIIILFYNKLR